MFWLYCIFYSLAIFADAANLRTETTFSKELLQQENEVSQRHLANSDHLGKLGGNYEHFCDSDGEVVILASLQREGLSDMVCQRPDKRITYRLNKGDGTFGGTKVLKMTNLFGKAVVLRIDADVHCADLNNDGIDDFILRNRGDGRTLNIFQNKGQVINSELEPLLLRPFVFNFCEGKEYVYSKLSFARIYNDRMGLVCVSSILFFNFGVKTEISFKRNNGDFAFGEEVLMRKTTTDYETFEENLTAPQPKPNYWYCTLIFQPWSMNLNLHHYKRERIFCSFLAWGHYHVSGVTTVPVTTCTDAIYGDINGDGITDLICPKYDNGHIEAALGTGDGSFNTGRMQVLRNSGFCKRGSNDEFKKVVVGDIDGDGKDDLTCWRHKSAGKRESLFVTCPAGLVGGKCEHNICSSFLKSLVDATNFGKFKPGVNSLYHTRTPKSFDYTIYLGTGHTFEIKPVFGNSVNRGSVNINFVFTPSTQGAIDTYYIANLMADPLSIQTSQRSCSNPKEYSTDKADNNLVLTGQRAEAGKSYDNIKFKSKWVERFRPLKGDNWDGEVQVPIDTPGPEKILPSIQVPFFAKFKFVVFDKAGRVPIEFVNIRYKVGPTTVSSYSNSDGIVIGRSSPGMSYFSSTEITTQTAAIDIVSATKLTGEESHTILFCGETKPNGVDGECSTALSSEVNVGTVEHLMETKTFYLIDASSRDVSGVIDYTLNGKRVPIQGVEVIVKDSLDNQEVGRDTTTSEGKFIIGAAIGSRIILEMNYNNHTFVANDQNSEQVLQSGVPVPDTGITNLHFSDTTTRDLTIQAGISECNFPIKKYVATFTAEQDPAASDSVEVSLDDSSDEYVYKLPAHAFNVQLEFSNEELYVDVKDVQDYYNDFYPSSKKQIDQTNNPQVFRFMYNMKPTLNVDFLGAETDFSSIACRIVPDAILNGNVHTIVVVGMKQKYNGNMCTIAPENTKVSMATKAIAKNSEGVVEHPCYETNDNPDGCTLEFKENNYPGALKDGSFALTTLYVGDPETHKNRPIGDILQRFKFTLENTAVWNRPFAFKKNVLIVGHEVITKNAIVAIPQQIPLYLLYAPPTSVNSVRSFASVRQKLNIGFTEKLLDVSEESKNYYGTIGIHVGLAGSLCAGLGVETCHRTFDFEREVGFSHETIKSEKTVKNHRVEYRAEGDEITLKTPPGKSGEEGDMALMMGTVARFIKSTYHEFDESTCTIDTYDSITWESEQNSVLWFSYAHAKRKLQLTEETIINQEYHLRKELTAEKRQAALELLQTAEMGKANWLSVLAFWDHDKAMAKELHPVDIRDKLVGDYQPADGEDSVNVFTMNGGDVALTETKRHTLDIRSSLPKYESYTSSSENLFSTEGHSILVGVGNVFGASYGTVTKYEYEFSGTDSEESEYEYRVQFWEEDSLDDIAVEVYRSPHSGSYVFNVAGGTTMCPRIPGTDAHQEIDVKIVEQPHIISEDRGEILLEISTKKINGANGVEDIELEIELDSNVLEHPVGFGIGSATLNQPFEYRMLSGDTRKVRIWFERSDKNLNRLTVGGIVRSKCDPSIRDTFPFTVQWQSECSSIAWGGALAEADSTFLISQGSPVLELELTSNVPNESFNSFQDMRVSLWYKIYNREGAKWEELSSQYYGDVDVAEAGTNSKLQIDGEALSKVFQPRTQYMLEARAICGDIEVRSGPRLGLYDNVSPSIMSWTIATNGKLGSRGINILSVMFDKPIDCIHKELNATISTDTTQVSGQIFCSAQAHKLDVYLPLLNEDDVTKWDRASLEVELVGVYDVFGNTFVDHVGSTDGAGRRLDENTMKRSFSSPNLIGEINSKRELNPNNEDMKAMVEEVRLTRLPKMVLTSSSTSIPGDGDGGLNPGAIAGIVTSAIVVVVAASVIVYNNKSTKNPFLQNVENMVKKEENNPMFENNST